MEELMQDKKTARVFKLFLDKCRTSQFGQVAIVAETRGGRIWRLSVETKESCLWDEKKITDDGSTSPVIIK